MATKQKANGVCYLCIAFRWERKTENIKTNARPSNNNNKRQQKLNNNNRFCLIAFEQQQWQYRQHYAWWSVCVLSNYALHSEAARGRNGSECKQFYVILLYYFLDVTIYIHCIAFLLLHFVSLSLVSKYHCEQESACCCSWLLCWCFFRTQLNMSNSHVVSAFI